MEQQARERVRMEAATRFERGESIARVAGRMRVGIGVQVPARRAVERDEGAIETWKKEAWPQAREQRRTWGRRGDTPVVLVRGKGRGQVNVAGLVCYRPGARSRLICRVGLYRRCLGEPKALRRTDYRDLLAAHRQLGGPIVLV